MYFIEEQNRFLPIIRDLVIAIRYGESETYSIIIYLHIIILGLLLEKINHRWFAIIDNDLLTRENVART